MWAPLTGGVKAGEDISSTIHREAKEELGIEVTNLKFIARQKHEEHFEEVWYAEVAGSTDPNTADINFILQKEEVDTITFVKGDDIKKFFEEGTLMEDSYFKTYIPHDL
jgi:ADP-ribose pyrophosphatase YjhB (NUDIX family)